MRTFLATRILFLRELLKRHWRKALQWREHIALTDEAINLLLAGVVGLLGGLVNLAFYLCVESVQSFALHRKGDLVEIASVFTWWQRLITPALGGLAAGLVLHWGFRLVSTSRSAGFLEVVVAGDGKMGLRSALIKALSSLLSISTGASIGREGLITQLTATLGSKLGQIPKWPPHRLRLLVACGAAAGLSAAYNVPISGAVFAAQIVLGNFSMSLFAPLIVSSVVAAVTSRTFFGIEPWYQVPVLDFTNPWQLPWFVLLGILAGVLGAAFMKMIHWSEQAFARLKLPIFVRLSLAGFIVGAIAITYPDVWGNGYAATTRILMKPETIQFLLGLFVAKLVATLVTVGSGTVGGVFTPTLFVGAALGAVLGTALHGAGWAMTLPVPVFALVGMGSVLAATTHSPLLALILIFEISLNYSLMPPLMLGCAVATLVARRFHPVSVYAATLSDPHLLDRREDARSGTTMSHTVGDLMQEPVPPLSEVTTVPQIAERFLTSTYNHLPVVNEKGRLIGIVALQDLKEFLNTGNELQGVIAADVMRPPPPDLLPSQTVLEVLPILLASDLMRLPVVNNASERRLVGALIRSDALAQVSQAIASTR
ncbi:MAG TPA: ClcB-like voltage-gated chloride channel protein [Roseimicrobium sp.]|nr:ClcB-like voltage-gated chloride channel protein [Roseimicrobium sp.]